MQEENKERTQTQIPITISTSYTHQRKDDKIRQQIDQTSYYLGAIFWFMKAAVEGYDLLDMQTSTKLFRFDDFRGNVQLMAEIGAGLSEQLTLYSCGIPNFDEKAPAKNVPDIPIAARDSEDEREETDFGTIDTASEENLAAVVSAVLQNPNLPQPMYDAIKNGLTDVFNSPRMNQREFVEYEETPEYIAKVFRGYALKDDD